MEKREKIHSIDYLEDFELDNSLELDDNIYSKDVRESLLENDELSPVEEAFMRGYEEAIK